MKTDNIWAPICGHAIYNAMSASVLPIEAVVNMGKTGAIMYTLLTVVCCSLFALKKEYRKICKVQVKQRERKIKTNL